MPPNRRKTRTEMGRELLEYFEIPLRRPFHVFIPFILILGAAVTLTLHRHEPDPAVILE